MEVGDREWGEGGFYLASTYRKEDPLRIAEKNLIGGMEQTEEAVQEIGEEVLTAGIS